jgi:hypothetical protein
MRPRPAARKSKKNDNLQKDNQNMAVRATRRISQRDSRYCGCINAASLNEKPRRAATITACAAPPAQRRSAQPCKSPACLNKKNRSPRDRYRLRRSTRASIAASPVRGQIQNPVGSRPPRLRSFTRDRLLHPATSLAGISLPRNKVNLRFCD